MSPSDRSSGFETTDGQESRQPLPTLHYWCYALHGLLLILQTVLLAMLWTHPERNVSVAFENTVLTVGLSAFQQAFYTFYTTSLVLVTQRLATTNLFSRRQKLTAIHDISSAWAGLGAAATTLWHQAKIAAAPRATLLVFLYLACITVLHVASPTIMGFQSYNATSPQLVGLNSSCLSPSVHLSGINIDVVYPLVFLMPSMSGLSTDGLINNTLYDTFPAGPQMTSATVNANSIQANCGLLPNLTIAETGSGGGYNFNITTEMSGVGEIAITIFPTRDLMYYPSLLIYHYECVQCGNSAVVFTVFEPLLQVDDSIGNNISVTMSFGFNASEPSGPQATAYLVACSLAVSNYTYSLPIEVGKLVPRVGRPPVSSPSPTWSLWTPQANLWGAELNAMISTAMSGGTCANGACGTSQGETFYSFLDTPSNATNAPLTRYQLENALSQSAAQLIWIAGQLGAQNGGFVPSPSHAEVTENVPRWRLNINTVPAVSTFIASFILLNAVYLMFGTPSKNTGDHHDSLVEGVTLLELLWIGARIGSLRRRMQAIRYPSPEKLRSEGMFDVSLAQDHEVGESANAEEAPLLNSHTSSVRVKDEFQGAQVSEHRHGTQRRVSLSQHILCYGLHAVFILLHVVLLLVLMHHREHRFVVQSVDEVYNVVLAELLQLFYVLYTLILVFFTQRLALSRATACKHTLTHMHDVSQAWTSLGSSLVGLWQQTKVAASPRLAIAIAAYFLCVSLLHIVSTTIIQFETFSSSRNDTVVSSLGWPASWGNRTYDWGLLSPIVPLDRLPSLSTNGWVENVVYDTPSVDATSVNAIVNATAIHANCGLLSNLSLSQQTDMDFTLNATVPGMGTIATIVLESPWKDMVVFLPPVYFYNVTSPFNSLSCDLCNNYLFYIVTTGLDVDDSLSDGVSVGIDWVYTPPGGAPTMSQTATYIVACSLDATTTSDVLFVQNNSLASRNQPPLVVPSRSWSLWSPGGIPALGYQISTVMGSSPDGYVMSLLGINATANAALSLNESSAHPSVMLGPAQFEGAVSKVAAQYIWAAGHTNGQFGPGFGTGESVVTDLVLLWRLNINAIPAVIVSAASVLLLFLAVYMVGITPSALGAMDGLGVLQALWMEAHSEALHEYMLRIDDPTLSNLRVAGMFEVCIADDVREVLEKQYDEVGED